MENAKGGDLRERRDPEPADRAARLELRLYVAGTAPNSVRAQANLRAALEPLDAAAYSLEVIDCLSEPLRVLKDGILVTPTLVKAAPAPAQTVVGTLGDPATLVEILGIRAPGPRSGTYD